MDKYNRLSTEFSKSYLTVDTKIITLSDVIVDIQEIFKIITV